MAVVVRPSAPAPGVRGGKVRIAALATNSPYSSNVSPPPPVVGDPVAVLERHETALAGFRAGLVDLEASPSYLMLTGDDAGPTTRQQVGAVAREAADLWPLLHEAEAALAQIRTYLSDNGAGGRHRAELTRLLSERWLPVELPSTAVPGAAAGTAGGRSVTPTLLSVGEALDGFRRRYDAIRGPVSEVDALFRALLPRIDSARKTLTRLDTEVAALGVPEPLIGRARALALDLERRLVEDPLALSEGDGPQLDAAVAAAATQVTTLRSGHDQLEADLGSTEEVLASLRLLLARAQAGAADARAKVVDPTGLVQVPSAAVLDGPGGLAARLDGILARTDATWDQRRALLDGWLATARKLEAQLARAGEANRAPLAQRDELRGRLRAYQAKMSAVGRAEDLELTAVVDQARTRLFTAPTDLVRAAASIDELARRLRS